MTRKKSLKHNRDSRRFSSLDEVVSRAITNQDAVETLSEEMISEFKEIFSLFDTSGDSTIAVKNLKEVLICLGQTLTQEELDELMYEHEIDTTGDGRVGFVEFLNLMARKIKETKEVDQMREIFNVFDKNKDGFISASEIQCVVTSLGETLNEDEVNEMVREADRDLDSKISFDDFSQLLNPYLETKLKEKKPKTSEKKLRYK